MVSPWTEPLVNSEVGRFWNDSLKTTPRKDMHLKKVHVCVCVCVCVCVFSVCSHPVFSVLGIFTGKNTGVGCHFFSRGKGDQSWVFTGRTDAEAESPVLWPPHAKSWLIGKDPDAGRDWGQEEKGTTEDKMAGWHHWLDGRELGWTPGVGDGQGGLACCGSWGRKESDTIERLNWT